MVQSSQRCSFVIAYETLQEILTSAATFSGGFAQAQPHFTGDSWDEIRGVLGCSRGFRGIPRQQCVQCPAKSVVKIGTNGNYGKGFLRLSCTPL